MTPEVGGGPETEVLLADSVGLALLVVLDRLPSAERLAYVLHDMFNLPFEDIALIVERSPTAARQLASRARRLARRGFRCASGSARPRCRAPRRCYARSARKEGHRCAGGGARSARLLGA